MLDAMLCKYFVTTKLKQTNSASIVFIDVRSISASHSKSVCMWIWIRTMYAGNMLSPKKNGDKTTKKVILQQTLTAIPFPRSRLKLLFCHDRYYSSSVLSSTIPIVRILNQQISCPFVRLVVDFVIILSLTSLETSEIKNAEIVLDKTQPKTKPSQKLRRFK